MFLLSQHSEICCRQLDFNIINLNALNICIIIYIGREEFNTYQKSEVDKGHP